MLSKKIKKEGSSFLVVEDLKEIFKVVFHEKIHGIGTVYNVSIRICRSPIPGENAEIVI